MTLDKDNLFAIQREVLKNQSEVPDPNFLSDYSQRVPIDAEQGQGFFDFHYFDHVLLGRADCLFHTDSTFKNAKHHYHYGIQILLSGELSVSLAATQHKLSHKAPEIWLSKGDFGTTQVDMAANQRVRNIMIEFSADFIEPLGREANATSLCKQLIDAESPSFVRLPTPSAEILKMAWELYDYAGAVTHLDLMAIQGATFSLISHLLNSSALPKNAVSKARAGAERARHLLDRQYADHWQTRQLAKRAGINECDLKREFKALTGVTINHYLRSQRMRVALHVLEKGETNLAKIAEQTGYQSKDYFVRVFRDYYGFHPKVINS